MLRKFSWIFICLALTGCCGFKMRGSFKVPDYLKIVYISPYEPYEPLQNTLRTRLKKHNVKIVNQPQDNVTVLQLSRATTDEQILADGSSGEVQRYRLTMSVSYTLIIKGEKGCRMQRDIVRTRELNRSINMLLSNEGEAQIVKKELLSETVNEILRQITARPSCKDDNP